MELLFKNARDVKFTVKLLFKNARDVKFTVKLIFVMIWKKEVKRTDDHCIFFYLGSDWDFSNIDSVFNTGEPEKFDYEKVKTTFGPPLLPIKHPHWTPPLTNLRGGGPDHAPPTYA